jgi:hypothetical protein
MTRTEWVVALIRRHHLATPQFSRMDRIVLMEVHRELHAIGALLRGLASDRSPDGVSASDDEVGTRLMAAVAKIEQQLRGLRRGIKGNFEYWSVDP